MARSGSSSTTSGRRSEAGVQCGWLSLIALLAAAPAHAQAERRATELWSTDSLAVVLVEPRSLVIISDCSAWVADPRSGVLRFDCEGRFLGQVGRVGAGPGEYRRPWAVFAFPGDSVVLFDPTLQRLSYFRPDARFVLSEPLLVAEYAHGRLMGMARYRDGIRVWTNNYPSGEPRPNERRAYVWTLGPTGEPVDSILAFDGPESIIRREEGTSSRVDAPFQRRPFVLFREASILVGNNGDSTLQEFTPRGVRQSAAKVALPVLRVAEEDRRAYRDSVRTSYFDELAQQRYGPRLRAFFAEAFDRLLGLARYPSTWQLYDLLLLGDDGSTWILLPSNSPNYDRTWLRIDTLGRVRQRVAVPHEGFVVAAAVRNDRLWAIEVRRVDGVRRVAAYRLPPE